jgi:hypothetical protein
MKRVLGLGLISVLSSVLVIAGLTGCSDETMVAPTDAFSSFSVTTVNGQPNTSCTELLAGQTIPAGTVCFEVVGSSMNVTYTTVDGWELTEAHLWVGCEPDGYPQTRSGNPKIGNFPNNSGSIDGTTTYTFSFDLSEFQCLDAIDCTNGNLLYAMAHASVRKADGSGGYQTETGWADGNPAAGRNWATQVAITMFDDSCGGGTGNSCYDHETAFAFDGDQSGCFQNYPEYLDNPNRWGWTNGPYAPGTYTWDVYARAGQCDLSKGTLVGTAILDYDGTTATVTYNLTGGWILETTHAYVGCEEFARNKQGEFTLAPGQYGSTNDFDPATGTTISTHTITGLDGCDVYAVIHAAVLIEVPCSE